MMRFAPTRFAPTLATLLLCGSVLAGCASDNNRALANLGQHKNISPDSAPLSDIDGNVRQAQLARVAGHYDDAIHTLSQLMLVAADDPRVVGEYGKTLVEKGRAPEAVQFLTRATELQPRDWTLYSALGVAYDEVGNQDQARQAYTHALALKPDEPSILNNYALSRMLAGDPAMARELMASAAKAGGASDPKIAHNIALVNSLAASAAMPVAQAAQAPAVKAPAAEVASRTSALLPKPVSAPGALPAVPAAASKANPQVVMEPVPVDPLAGPVKPRAKAQTKPAMADDKTAKPADAKTAAPKNAIPNLRQASLSY